MLGETVAIQPITSVTDLIMTFEAAILIYLIITNTKKSKLTDTSFKLWIGGYCCILLFSLLGAISHLLTDSDLVDIFWPPTMIFGGISFVFVVSALIFHVKPENNRPLLLIPIVLVIGYVIFAILNDWAFIVWVGLLVICSILIYILGISLIKKANAFGKYVIIGNSIVLLSGIVQAVGGMVFYPEGQDGFSLNSQGTAMFKPHNDAFHLIACIGLLIFYIGLKKVYFSEKLS